MNIASINSKAVRNIVLSLTTKKEGPRKRQFVQYLACNEFEDLVLRNSIKKKVTIADGVGCNGKNQSMVVIDHVLEPAHKVVMKRKKLHALWENQDSRRLWINIEVR